MGLDLSLGSAPDFGGQHPVFNLLPESGSWGFIHSLSPLAEGSCPLSLFNAASLPGRPSHCPSHSESQVLQVSGPPPPGPSQCCFLCPGVPPRTGPSLWDPGGLGRLQTIGMDTGLSGAPAGVTARPSHTHRAGWQSYFTLGVQACITALARSLVCSY